MHVSYSPNDPDAYTVQPGKWIDYTTTMSNLVSTFVIPRPMSNLVKCVRYATTNVQPAKCVRDTMTIVQPVCKCVRYTMANVHAAKFLCYTDQ